MASIRKRIGKGGVSYSAEIRRANSPPESMTFKRHADAKQWATRREAEIDAGKTGIILPHTVAEAFARYAVDESPKRKGVRWEQVRLNKLAGPKGCTFRGKDLTAVTATDIAEWRDLAQKTLKKNSDECLSASSVRREMTLVRSVFEICRLEWGWLRVNPMAGVKKPREGLPRTRRVSDNEIERILLALGWGDGEQAIRSSQRVAVAVLWAVETAMRAGELVSLTPKTINAKARVASVGPTKNGDYRDVPLSSAAVKLLDYLPHGSFRLTSGTLDTLWRRARDNAGLVDLHFHDLRAEALTRMARKVDVLTLARIAGHRDLKSLQVYYRESASDIAARLD